jgi:hypothetical protein
VIFPEIGNIHVTWNRKPVFQYIDTKVHSPTPLTQEVRNSMVLVNNECLSPREIMKEALAPPNIKKEHEASKKRRWDDVDFDILPLSIF